MKSIIFFIISFILLYPSTIHSQALEDGIKSLTKQIISGMSSGNKQKIAIIEFSDLDGRVTELGIFFAEELITKLFLSKKFYVVERQLLNKVLQEQKLNYSGLVDKDTAKELGRILGVDAICSGTITDLVDNIKVNSRLVATETGEIFAVASTLIKKDYVVKSLLGKIAVQKSIKISSRNLKPSNMYFKEDLSSYRLLSSPEIYGGLWVIEDKFTKKKVLSPPNKGRYSFEINTEFPDDFDFSFDLAGSTGNNDSNGFYVALFDNEGKVFKFGVIPHDVGGGSIKIVLPDGVKKSTKLRNDLLFNFRLQKKGNAYKAYLNDKYICSTQMPGFTKFVMFTVTLNQWKIGGPGYAEKWRYRLTNIKIGSL